jgi:rhodanese-related sulfurtransferase
MKMLSWFFRLGLLTLLCSCSGALQKSNSDCLGVADFSDTLAHNTPCKIIDVRTPEEFDGGHLEGAVNLDVQSDAFVEAVREFPKSEAILVYCQGGVRSHRAAEQLRSMRFKRVYDLCGGLNAWSEAGKAVVH